MPIVKPYFSPLSFQEIALAFNSPVSSVGLRKYYRGGQYVEDTDTNATVPVSGTIATSDFYGSVGAVQKTQNLPENTTLYNYDIYTNRGAGYIAGSTSITLIIPATTTIGSKSYALPAVIVPATFTTGDKITIINRGNISGCGGDGATVSSPSPGLPGSPGLGVAFPVTVTNTGTIAGGGGGGGAGGLYRPNKGDWGDGGAGGGGAGIVPGKGQPGGAYASASSPGDATTGGAGGAVYSYNGRGGNGGNLGQPGQTGAGSTYGPSPGGPAGNAVSGNAYITWTALGTRIGPIA